MVCEVVYNQCHTIMIDLPALPIEKSSPTELPKQPWVESLSSTGRETYDQRRATDIETDVEDIIGVFRSLVDFDGVSKEAVGYVALRLATSLRDGYEQGVQVGMDLSEQAVVPRFQGALLDMLKPEDDYIPKD